MQITPEMVAQVRERINWQRESISVVMVEEKRQGLTPGQRKHMEKRGLQFALPPGPLTIIMMDEIEHTTHFPVCGDSEHCCCYQHEREQIIQETTPKRRRRSKTLISVTCETPGSRSNAPLNGNRIFSLLK